MGPTRKTTGDYSVDVHFDMHVCAHNPEEAERLAVKQIEDASYALRAEIASVDAHRQDPQPLNRYGVSFTVHMPVYARSEEEAECRGMNYISFHDHVIGNAEFDYQQANLDLSAEDQISEDPAAPHA